MENKFSAMGFWTVSRMVLTHQEQGLFIYIITRHFAS